jgi:hypothetical protein
MNEINSLGVKKIDDTELIRKILHLPQRPEYDLVITVLYEKELDTLTPNQVLNKVITHELRHDIKSRVPPPSPIHSALACKQIKKLKEMAIKGSSSEEEEEEACQNSSNDEKEPMDPNLYKQVKKMNKCLKEINSIGYMVFLKDGHHHQLMKLEKRFKKKQLKKEKKPKHESFAIFGEWVSGGKESSASSSDESNKKFTTRTNIGSSSNTCFMAQGMESDVSDDLNVTLATNYDDLLRKF